MIAILTVQGFAGAILSGDHQRNESGQQSRVSAGPYQQPSFSRTGWLSPLSSSVWYPTDSVKPYALRKDHYPDDYALINEKVFSAFVAQQHSPRNARAALAVRTQPAPDRERRFITKEDFSVCL